MLSLLQMRGLVREGLGGLDEQDLRDPDLDMLLNMSYWEIESRFPFEEKNARVEWVTVVGTEEYSIDAIMLPDALMLEAIQSIAVIKDEQSYKLQRMTQAYYDEKYTENTDARGIPRYYLRRDDSIVLYPIPDEVYTMRLYFLKTLAAILVGSVEILNFPREWDELVVEGAVTRGHYYRQDYQLARESENFRVAKLRTASTTHSKEEEDSRYAGLVVQWDEPGA
jgi:hypothetical protein